MTDLSGYVEPVSADAPSGEDLEYDSQFGEMERAAQPKAEQQFGDTVVEGTEPEWLQVKKHAIKLLDRTRDLRVSTLLARALLHTDGVVGFSDGLHLTRQYVENFWDTVYPQLDPDDDNDPTFRVNSLVSLCDADTTVKEFRAAPLVSSRLVGRFCLRDVLVATGQFSLPETSGLPRPDTATIDAAFTDVGLEELQATAVAVSRARQDVVDIERLLTEFVGAAQSADFSPLADELKTAEGILAGHLKRRGVGVEPEPVDDEPADAGTAASNGSPKAAKLDVGALEIHTRDDVVRVLDRVCDYYTRFEPSSPIPLLLQRARGLVTKTFLEILQDLAPDGLHQGESLRGAFASNREADSSG